MLYQFHRFSSLHYRGGMKTLFQFWRFFYTAVVRKCYSNFDFISRVTTTVVTEYSPSFLFSTTAVVKTYETNAAFFKKTPFFTVLHYQRGETNVFIIWIFSKMSSSVPSYLLWYGKTTQYGLPNSYIGV